MTSKNSYGIVLRVRRSQGARPTLAQRTAAMLSIGALLASTFAAGISAQSMKSSSGQKAVQLSEDQVGDIALEDLEEERNEQGNAHHGGYNKQRPADEILAHLLRLRAFRPPPYAVLSRYISTAVSTPKP